PVEEEIVRLNRYALVLVVLLVAAPLAACGGSSAPGTTSTASTATTAAAPSTTTGTPATPGAAGGNLTFTDATGTTVTLPHPARRVVCLVGLCEDIMAALGLPPVAVNDTYSQDPHLFGAQAKSFAMIGGSFTAPNIEDIAKATPDLVIGIANADEQLRPALKPIAPLFIMNPATYQDSITYLEDIGRLTGRTAQAAAAAQKFTTELATYKAQSPNNVSTVLIYGAGPNFNVFTTGSLTPSVLQQVTPYAVPAPTTGAPASSDHEPGAIPGSLEQLLTINPDTILVASFAFTPTAKTISQQLASDPVWSQLKAVKDHRVYEVNANYYVFGRGTISLGLALQDTMSKLYPSVVATPTP
ncbi:MAG TPA: ABC transporter substrate-binding protein, partial [Thermomicrobiaceae bacterium]|nr:ABC transporter substrate-binding protein [Thermomicrobiaceae bacterium]